MTVGARLAASTTGVAAVAAGALVASVDPNEPGRYPVCPFRWATGLDCPGCGTLRALHALAHGDLGAAFDHNAAAVLLLPILVVVWMLWLARAGRGRPAPVLPPWGAYATAGALTTFWVARNLPWDPLTVLASGS